MDLKPKVLLKRMVDFALSEIDRRSRPPQRFPAAPAARADTPAPEVEALKAAPVPRKTSTSSRPPVEAELPLDVSRAASGAIVVRWSVFESDVSAARSLLEVDGTLVVRLVSFSADPQAFVRREVVDLPAATSAGYVTVQRPEQERLVVSVGLLAGEQFVSIVHAHLDC